MKYKTWKDYSNTMIDFTLRSTFLIDTEKSLEYIIYNWGPCNKFGMIGGAHKYTNWSSLACAFKEPHFILLYVAPILERETIPMLNTYPTLQHPKLQLDSIRLPLILSLMYKKFATYPEHIKTHYRYI